MEEVNEILILDLDHEDRHEPFLTAHPPVGAIRTVPAIALPVFQAGRWIASSARD